MPEIAPGTIIGGYEIEAEVGRGQRGIVYRAIDQRDAEGHVVALKAIRSDLAQSPEFRAMLARQVRAIRALDHPSVVPLHECGYEQGVLFTTMRYIAGGDLARVLERGRLEPSRAARLVAEVAAALDAAHARGIVHRDVKPADVLLADLAGHEHAYLTGLELPKQSHSGGGVTGMGLFVGAVDYMAPETLAGGQVDHRADIYALGCVLYHALTGTVPFPLDTPSAKMYAHVSQPIPSIGAGATAAGLDEVLRIATAKDPGERYERAGELGRAALAAAGGGFTVPAPAATELAPRQVAAPTVREPQPTELLAPQPSAATMSAPSAPQAVSHATHAGGPPPVAEPARRPERDALEVAAFAVALAVSAVLIAVGADLAPAAVVLAGLWGAIVGGLFRRIVADAPRPGGLRVAAIAVVLVASPLLFFWLLDIPDRLALACSLAEVAIALVAATPAFTRARPA